MYIVRRWTTRHARFLESLYRVTAGVFHALDTVWGAIGLERLERPFTTVESLCKGFLFDCRMCGQCRLSVTGMTCVMNCPKHLQNGPCGGVRADGRCEVKPDMRCVWVEAWSAAQRMRNGMAIRAPLPQLDFSLQGTSAWLRLTRENLEMRKTAREQKGKAV